MADDSEFIKPDPLDCAKAIKDFLRSDSKDKMLPDGIKSQLERLSSSIIRTIISTSKPTDYDVSHARKIDNAEVNKNGFNRLTGIQKHVIQEQFKSKKIEMPVILVSRKTQRQFVIIGQQVIQYSIFVLKQPIKVIRITY